MSVTVPDANTRADPNAPQPDEVRELQKRATAYRRLEEYFRGDCPLPDVIRRANITQVYRMLMAFSETNFARLIVRAASGRGEVVGIASSRGREIAARGWAIWRDNQLEAESARAMDIALTHGRVFANIWMDDDGDPTTLYETPDVILVRYKDGTRHIRDRAVRIWREGQLYCANVTTAEALYKWQSSEAGGPWSRRAVPDEEWPLPHGFGDVPVVEIATKGIIKTGYPFGIIASGDFEHLTGLLDRINILEFLRLVIAFSQGFPVRVVVGEEIRYRQLVEGGVLKDDLDHPIAPFKLAADVIAQLENPDARLEEFRAADLSAFGTAMDRDTETLAGLSMTPSYFLRSVPIQNVSADAIVAADVPLITRVTDHLKFLGVGHRETIRMALAGLGEELPEDAEIQWADVERYSFAQRADAFQKITGGAQVPWQVAAEMVLNASPEQIARWEAMGATNALLNQPTSPLPQGQPANGGPPEPPRPPLPQLTR